MCHRRDLPCLVCLSWRLVLLPLISPYSCCSSSSYSALLDYPITCPRPPRIIFVSLSFLYVFCCTFFSLLLLRVPFAYFVFFLILLHVFILFLVLFSLFTFASCLWYFLFLLYVLFSFFLFFFYSSPSFCLPSDLFQFLSSRQDLLCLPCHLVFLLIFPFLFVLLSFFLLLFNYQIFFRFLTLLLSPLLFFLLSFENKSEMVILKLYKSLVRPDFSSLIFRYSS